MASPRHLNTKAGSPPYKNLFSNVTIAPSNASLAYISTQWAADPATGELVEGVANDYAKQSKIVWENIVEMFKELGVGVKDIVHRTISFKEFNDDIGKESVEGMMAGLPDDWKQGIFSSSLTFNGVSHFHRPGIVVSVDLVVAVPSK